MIKNRIAALLGERRENVSEFARRAGISRNAAHRLYHDTSGRIDIATLDRACDHLGVGVGDILVHVPSGDGARHVHTGTD